MQLSRPRRDLKPSGPRWQKWVSRWVSTENKSRDSITRCYARPLGAGVPSTRPVASLDTRGAKSFLRVVQIFLTMSKTFKLCSTHFPGEAKIFLGSPPLLHSPGYEPAIHPTVWWSWVCAFYWGDTHNALDTLSVSVSVYLGTYKSCHRKQTTLEQRLICSQDIWNNHTVF